MLIIRRAFVCVCARMCVVHLSTCLVIASFHYGAAGGRAALQHCNEINDPWFFRCDQQTKLSSRSETKGVMGGKKNKKKTKKEKARCIEAAEDYVAVVPGALSVGSVDKHQTFIHIHPHCTSLSQPPPSSLSLPFPILSSSPLLSA